MSEKRPGQGGPGTLRKWLYTLHLAPSEHRVMDLLCETADAEDGCCWPSVAWLARWSVMSERNVQRIIRKLADPERKGGPLLRVHAVPKRTNVYQVLCPELPRLDDLSRVAMRRGLAPMGDNLSGDRLSGDTLSPRGDISGPEGGAKGDNSGQSGVTICHPEHELPEEDHNYEGDQGKEGAAPAQAPTTAPADTHSVPDPSYTVWDDPHSHPIRPRGDDTAVVCLIPCTATRGRPVAVTEQQVAKWEAIFPAVDVRKLLVYVREVWCANHPRQLKTGANIPRWLTEIWLRGEQDKGPRSTFYRSDGTDGRHDARPPPPASRTREAFDDLDRWAEE